MDHIEEILLDNINNQKNDRFNYPLIENTYDKEDIIKMIQVLLSDKLTMGEKVLSFEHDFTKFAYKRNN